jgi:hypothetical protein
MSRIDFTVEQARKVIATVPQGTHYWFEAQRVLREAGSPPWPVPGSDVPKLSYDQANNDDGDGL